jgi:hypothetical protein
VWERVGHVKKPERLKVSGDNFQSSASLEMDAFARRAGTAARTEKNQ